MQIQSPNGIASAAAAAVNAAAPAGDATNSNDQTKTGNVTAMANENTFLQLLVAQIKNQDPLQPTDGVQFLSQLAQFSQLEQLIGIRQELQTVTDPAADPQNATAPVTN